MIDMNNLITEPFIRDAEGRASEETDLEKGKQVLQSNYDLGMEDFNKQIQEAEIQVHKLSGILFNLKVHLVDANEESKPASKTVEIKATKKRMEKYINEVGKIAHNVSEKLQLITIDNILFRQMPGCQKGTASDRTRMNTTSVLTKKLKELMIEFETLHETIQDEYREVVERRALTVTDTRPEEPMIDHLIEIGNGEQIFQNAFEQQMGQGKVISTVEEIQERNDDTVKKIEKRLSELHQIYLKTEVLVEGQAKIENQVTDAGSSSRSKMSAVQTANNSQSIVYKLVFIIWLLAMVIINNAN